ncbi:helix-turn-helix transcriptional regulator [Brevibacillus sp. TJ4]|uniref:helix-turn-helix transcriptional regulator n=1 Tax=Brevibacillus sp. TJ4 TaxID=3234853 RepID=UPI003BA2D123
MSKTDNMLSILWLLKSGRRMTARQLADELEIHIRTVYRCIDSLCASGVPIIAEPGHHGGYRIMEHFAKAPLLFSMEEQKALIHASIFARDSGYPFTDALNRAVGKLKRYTNEEQLAWMERHAEGFSVIHPPSNAALQMRLQLLAEATAQEQTVELEYVKDRGIEPTIRRLDPYGIVHWKGSWYTVGYCHVRQQYRSFRVDRIVRVEHTEQSFQRPDSFSPRDFLLQNLLPGSLDAESLLTVRIQGSEQALDELCKHWLFAHALLERTGGQAMFRLGEDSLRTYVPYFLLPYGKAIVIAEPDILLDKMIEVTSGMAAHYRMMKEKEELAT